MVGEAVQRGVAANNGWDNQEALAVRVAPISQRARFTAATSSVERPHSHQRLVVTEMGRSDKCCKARGLRPSRCIGNETRLRLKYPGRGQGGEKEQEEDESRHGCALPPAGAAQTE